MASEDGFEPRLRLHPLSWLFALLGFARQFILPLAAAIFFGARNDPELWGLVAVVPLLGAALWHQYTYRYGFGPHGLVIRAGYLVRSVRQIEYRRIENIDTERGPLHRLLRVAEVRVETSTGGKPEGLIRVLGLREAAELREQIFGRRDGRAEQSGAHSPARARPETLLLHLPPGELVRFGLVDNRAMILIAAAVGVAYQNGVAERLFNLMYGWLPGLDDFVALTLVAKAALAAGLLLSGYVGLHLLSTIIALLTLHDFRLARDESGLRIRHGLLTRVSLTLRLPRVQALRQTASLMHRLLGRVSLSVDLAGDSVAEGEKGQGAAKRIRWLAPMVEPGRARDLIAAAIPAADVLATHEWRALAPGASGRIFRRTIMISVIVALPLAGWLYVRGTLSWLSILVAVVPIAWLHATAYARHTRWALSADLLLFRSGWIRRELVIVPRNRLQTVRVGESPLDRRARMASVSVDTAGGSASSAAIRIPYLERNVAIELGTALYASACSRGSSPADLPDVAVSPPASFPPP